jgi:hypothetical protein
MNRTLAPTGTLLARRIKPAGPGLRWRLSNYLRWSFLKSWIGVFLIRPIARAFGLATAYGKLEATLIRKDGSMVRYGALSYRVVTSAFVAFVTDQLQTETSVFGDFKYHDAGVGVTAENASDTAIETTDGESRATGTQTESAANVYQSVGTISYTTTKAITEHGLFNDASAGTLMDRTVFAAINVVNGDSIQFTYSLTLTAGS